MSSPPRALPALAWLGFYGALVVWLTWPLGAYLGTHFADVKAACRFDAPLDAWALAHQARALTSDWLSFPHAGAFHPSRFALYYGEAGFGALPFFLPAFLITGNPTLAENVMMLASFALTAWTLHLVAQTWTGSAAAGLAAAATLLTSRWLLWEWPPCCPNYAVLFYFPVIVALAADPEPSRGRSIVLAVVAALQASVSVYLAAAVLAPLALLGLVRTVRAETRSGGLRLLVVVAAAVLLVAPLYSGYLVVRLENPDIADQTLWRTGIPPLRLPAGYFGFLSPMAVPFAALAVIAAGAALHLAFAPREGSLVLRRGWRVAAFFAVLGLVLSLTPEVIWSGERVRQPLAVLDAWLPLYRVLRVPLRLGVAGLMGICLLVGLAFFACTRALEARGPRGTAAAAALAALLALAMLGERRAALDPFGVRVRPSFGSYPIAAAPSLDGVVAAALADGSGPVLELPVGVDGTLIPAWQVGAMYRSIEYRRPVLNGYHGYWPADFPARLRLAEALPDAAALARLRAETGLTDVLVRLDDLRGPARTAWEALAERGGGDGLRLVLRRPGVLLFNVSSDLAPARDAKDPS
ncbi:MAG: hypothetical protein FJ144_26490 [Deltaproteobacteria bacterium]|nr:hypothetical protein [Deltaproteobacteria bacterium]